jgi:excisionase family DNA binding protein
VVEVVRDELDDAITNRLAERKPWLTLAEAAERLGCSTDAVRMRVKRGRLEHRRQGRRLYISAESLDRLQTRHPTATTVSPNVNWPPRRG